MFVCFLHYFLTWYLGCFHRSTKGWIPVFGLDSSINLLPSSKYKSQCQVKDLYGLKVCSPPVFPSVVLAEVLSWKCLLPVVMASLSDYCSPCFCLVSIIPDMSEFMNISETKVQVSVSKGQSVTSSTSHQNILRHGDWYSHEELLRRTSMQQSCLY